MTEKSYNPKQKEKKAMKKQEAVQTLDKKLGKKISQVKIEEKKGETQKQEKVEDKKEVSVSEKPEIKTEEKVSSEKDKKETSKKEVQKVKKTDAIVNGKSVPLSTKYAVEICKFIKYKSIDIAIKDLEQVLAHKKAIPMKGEYAHKKGKGMAGGKYPKKATEHFIKLLKNLSSNAVANDLEEPIIISEAIPNMAARPRGRFGKWQRKRTHIKLVARTKKKENKK